MLNFARFLTIGKYRKIMEFITTKYTCNGRYRAKSDNVGQRRTTSDEIGQRRTKLGKTWRNFTS